MSRPRIGAGWCVILSSRQMLVAIGWTCFSALAILTACDSPQPGASPLLGTLERDRYDLVASAAEPIVEIAVREGQRVQAGDVLARLDDRRLQASLDSARAQVEGAAARLAELEIGGRAEQRRQARARLAANRSELAQARLDVERSRQLVETGVASQSGLDVAITRRQTTEARIEQDLAALEELEAGATSEQVRQAEAELLAMEASVTDLKVAFERLTLRAPVDGHVDALPYELGELPGAGATVVVLLAGGSAWARIYLPETWLTQIPEGTPARIEADGLAEPLPACVRFVAHEAGFTPHYALSEHDRHRLAFRTEVVALADASELPSGLPVRVFFEGNLPTVAECRPVESSTLEP